MTSETKFAGEMYGYVRVSTDDQKDQLQRDALREFGVKENMIFSDKMSGASMKRPGLARALKLLRSGDMLVVWKLDRLGRTVRGVLEAVENLEDEGIVLKSLTEDLNTSTPMGRMFMTILLALAQMERELISERTKAGMQAYIAKGGRTGPKHGIRDYPKRLAEFQRLFQEGDMMGMSLREIINRMNEVDPDAPTIKNTQMLSNWKAKGFDGVLSDPPLSNDEAQ